MLLCLFVFVVIVNAGAGQDKHKGYCRLETHPSVEYRCLISGGEGSRPCKSQEPPGTLVSPQCRSPLYQSASTLNFMRCLSGEWDYIARCSPVCGRVTPDGKELVVGGIPLKRGEIPWHAGIYKKTTSPYLQVCGGSLISTNVVISAAHCFWTDIEKQLPAFQFAVAVGKIYRQWNNNKDEAQKANVKAIHLPPRFQGSRANFQEDIAVVITFKEFKYETFVRPVCLSFDHDFEDDQLQSGNEGKVAGWGLTGADGKPSLTLQVLSLPYVDVSTCIKRSPPDFGEYITGDKICAGTQEEGSALCKGDSGGGLTFPEIYRHIERYFLRGVVSVAPNSQHACNTEAYTSFTLVTRHEHFIKQFWTESGQFKCLDGSVINAANHCDGSVDCADSSDETTIQCAANTCSSYLFQCRYGACVDKGATCNGVSECADGSDEAEGICGKQQETAAEAPLLSVGNKCVVPPYPEHGQFTVTNIAGAKPGEVYSLVTLNISCDAGFKLLGSSSLYCFMGQWQDSLPECTNEFRKDYTYYKRAGGWFKVHPVPVDWWTAGLLCHYEGAVIASPRTPEMVSVLKELLAKAVPRLQVYFAGIRHPLVEHGTNFIEEPPIEKLYGTWDEDMKTSGPQQCQVYSLDAVLRDFNCEDYLPYVCYRRFEETDQLTTCGTVDAEYKLDTSTGHCYKLHARAYSWDIAQKICRTEGGYLAIANSATEAQLLKTIAERAETENSGEMRKFETVIAGFREWGHDGSWWTINGETLAEAGYEEWFPENPTNMGHPEQANGTRKACGGFQDGKLRDIYCSEPYGFICEKTKESLVNKKINV